MARNYTRKNRVESGENNSYFDKLAVEARSNQSRISMVLGVLIVLVLGILVFNYFNKPGDNLGPAQTIKQEEDVSPDNLPGKYTVKEGDTLFLIAEKYYGDGYKYDMVAKENNLTSVDQIDKGQVLQIPPQEQATGGGNTTIWGPMIEGDTYTVLEGDWLSTIAARAYGDIYAYDKIAKANNIPNPDYITAGMVLAIPR